MPKLIDRGSKRDEIAAATWRVILRDGIGGVSIRTVATEAATSTGSLRHVFPSRVDLLVYAMQAVDARATTRILNHRSEADPRHLVINVIGELLPLDEERLVEMEVNVALFAESPTDARIAEVRDMSHSNLRRACVWMITHLRDHDLTDSGIEVGDAAGTLHALIDGIALHLIIHRDEADQARAWRMVVNYIHSLAPNHAAGGASAWPKFPTN